MSIWIFADIDSSSNPLPVFLIQVFITLVLTRLIGRILQYFKQPQVIGEMIGGIVLGPSVLGLIPNYTETIWPKWSLGTFSVAASIGLLFFMFIMGIQEKSENSKNFKRSFTIAVASIIFPFGVGVVNSFWLADYNKNSDHPPTNENNAAFILFCGTSLSFTAFPVLAALLESFKLIHYPIGQQSLQIASINDVLAWCVLAVASSFAASNDATNGGYIFLLAFIYILGMFLLVKPIMARIHKYFLDTNQEDSPYFLVVLFIELIISAYASEEIGIHAFFGSFIAGLVLPKKVGKINSILVPKLETVTKHFLLPLYFASSGIKTNIGSFSKISDLGIVVAIFCLAVIAKFVPGCFVTKCLMKNVSWRYCVTMGVLMNTRGLVELIALNVGLQTNILSIELFTILVIMAITTTLMTAPGLEYIYKKEHLAIMAQSQESHEIEIEKVNDKKNDFNNKIFTESEQHFEEKNDNINV